MDVVFTGGVVAGTSSSKGLEATEAGCFEAGLTGGVETAGASSSNGFDDDDDDDEVDGELVTVVLADIVTP